MASLVFTKQEDNDGHLFDEMSAPASVPRGSKSARGNNIGVDRFSSLSNDLLHHVMSFLPMREVVRTSLLSPRWRNLWESTPFIHIDHEEFKDENEPSVVDKHKLEKFGDTLLLLRDGTVSLDEARISFTDFDSSKISMWIRHAIKHRARLLHVSGFHDCPFLDSTAMFPSQYLKRITLQRICLYDCFTKLLNHNYPVLEHLELEFCSLYVWGISSSSLKVLRIINCVTGYYDLLISARNLMHFSLIDPKCCGGAVVIRDLSLASASISLWAPRPHDIDDTDTEVDNHMLDGLTHATMLELLAPLPKLAFEECLQACPTFKNLTRLVLGDWCMASDCYPLFHILHRCPKLKELTVKLHMEHYEVRKKVESVVLPSTGVPSIGGYPRVQRIKICCRKDDLRIDELVQALVPIVSPDGKITIEGH